jgi:choline dehydrogenase-like flavoprotein
MLIDGRAVPVHSTLRADVVVIGAGPAGITVAEELAGAGRHVVLVEAAGRHHGRADDDALDGDGSGEPFPLQRSRHRGFGGTSTHWTPATGLRVRPLDTVDFPARPCRPEDAWPFGMEQLAPDYERAYRSIGLDPANDPHRWFGGDSPTPLAWPGGPQLAMYQFAPHDCFTERFDRVHRTALIDLMLGATVCQLEPGSDDDSVHRAVIVTAGGRRFFLAAGVFVLACGGIDNARVLLNSPGRHGCPIGNEHDNVGRYFMDHLSVDTGVIVPTGSIDVASAIFREQRTAGDRYQAMLWLGDDIIEREGIANAAFWVEDVDPLYRSRGVGAARALRAAINGRPRRHVAAHATRAIRGAPSILAHAVRRVARNGPRDTAMRILTEQLPNRDSQIRLSPRRDALGMPRVDVDWRISGSDLDVIVAHQDLLGRLLADRGVATLTERFDPRSHPSPIMSNYHHLGTTRMHGDPRWGVVDSDGRVHSTSNVYIAGGSVFPTGGYLNPTLTILALAFRTARAIAERWQPITVGRDVARST